MPTSLARSSSQTVLIREDGESGESEAPIDILNGILNEFHSLPPDNDDCPPSHTSHLSHLNPTSAIPAMDEYARARALKRKLEKTITPLHCQDKHTAFLQEDPENALIVAMRNEQKMKWADIVNTLNDTRRERGEPADLTDKKLYSRYLQATTRISRPAREIGFEATDYQSLRDPHQSGGSDGGPDPGCHSRNSRKRIKNCLNPTELKENLRGVVSAEEDGELQTPEKMEHLLRAVERVGRNFWVFVADEMERETTKLYHPDILAKHYHAL